MTILEDKDARFKHLFGKVVLFIVLAVIGMGLAFIWVGIKKGAFTPKSPIYFVADSAQGLTKGMPVKFSGFNIGRLNDLALDDQGQVQVEAAIENKYLGLLRQDAMMHLKNHGLMEDGILEISRGSKDKPALAEGDTVRFERSKGLEQVLVEVKNRIMPVLDDFHRLLLEPEGDLRQTLKNLRDFSAELRDSRRRLDNVLLDADSGLKDEAVPLLRSLRLSTAHADALLIKLDRELPGLLTQVDTSLTNLQVSSRIFREALELSVPQLPDMVTDMHETVAKTRDAASSTQEMLDSLKARWPLSNLIPPPDNGPVKMDSHE